MNADRIVVAALLMAAIAFVRTCDVHARPVPPIEHEARIGICIREAAAGKVWLERTLWGLRDQEAGWLGARIENSNGTQDLGPLQVNSSWIPRLAKLTGRSQHEVRTWLSSDPCFNVQAARWIFLSGLAASGDYWKAVGIYHSPTLWRQRRYAGSVALHLRRRFGEAVFGR